MHKSICFKKERMLMNITKKSWFAMSRVSNSLAAVQNTRAFSVSGFNLMPSSEFDAAKQRLATFTEDPGNDVKLQLYALFKQATVGECNVPKPGMVDFVGRAKYNAWKALTMTQAEAEQKYIELIEELSKNEPEPKQKEQQKGEKKTFKDISTSIEYGNVYKIVMNRPAKYNAITLTMYREIGEALQEAQADPNIQIACITGAGSYYCSGNDLSTFTSKEAMADTAKAADAGGLVLEKFVESFIDFSKPLVSLVNGPAVGISVTLMGLCDLVVASDKATFNTPFTQTGQSPEACSSITFPRLMGPLKANELLLFNRKLSAQEAYERNLVNEVIPHDEFAERCDNKLQELSKLPKESLIVSRDIVRGGEEERQFLKQVNKQECEVLVARWKSKEFARVMMEFWMKRK